jgi:hypothetical protein
MAQTPQERFATKGTRCTRSHRLRVTDNGAFVSRKVWPHRVNRLIKSVRRCECAGSAVRLFGTLPVASCPLLAVFEAATCQLLAVFQRLHRPKRHDPPQNAQDAQNHIHLGLRKLLRSSTAKSRLYLSPHLPIAQPPSRALRSAACCYLPASRRPLPASIQSPASCLLPPASWSSAGCSLLPGCQLA